MNSWQRLTSLFFLLLCCSAFALRQDAAKPLEPDRSPTDLAMSADGHRLVVANATSGSVSLVDLPSARVVAETPVGRSPFGIAITHDGAHAVVTNQDSNDIALLDVGGHSLRVVKHIPVGDRPRGVALSPDGTTAWVALSAASSVAVIDLRSARVTDVIAVATEPWHIAITPDGARAVVDCARGRDASVIDTGSHKILFSVPLAGPNERHVAISPDGKWAYIPYIETGGKPTLREFVSNGTLIANRLSRIAIASPGTVQTMSMDPIGEAGGDLDGTAVSSDGSTLAVTSAGTHCVFVMPSQAPFKEGTPSGGHIDPSLMAGPGRLKRIPIGGRPLGAVFLPDGRHVAVANYLKNAVQIVDIDTAFISQTIPLGGPEQPSLARQGEAIFMDAARSWQHWYSCNTCHVEGGSDGALFDTFNDGSFGTLKKTPSIRGVTATGPYTWHGWETDLADLTHTSLIRTMQGAIPHPHEQDAILAYLATLDFRPNPAAAAPQTDSAHRGEQFFTSHGCVRCHVPPTFTSPGIYDVGLDEPKDGYKGFNPPSLRSVYDHAPYLHAGQAATLEEVLTKYHQPSRVSKLPDLTPAELSDLVAYLKTL
jgi:YVTN family beta-propeller protein